MTFSQHAYKTGKLQRNSDIAFDMLESCSICPRKCGVNRLKNQQGFCKTGLLPKVFSTMAHHGEEPPISGERGSGTIFFSNCNMACVYCQNYEFSQLGQGREVTLQKLAELMLELQKLGCHNINFVTPTHIMPQILQSLLLAIPLGLKIPLVYNTGGYELPEVLQLLDGIIDVYLPDMRYADAEKSKEYSIAPDYPQCNQASIKEMYRQVGTVAMDEKGAIIRGLIIRHLVLPHHIAGTDKILKFISEEITPETYISLMSQYLPYHKAPKYKDLSRRLNHKEYEEAKKLMEKYGLENGWIQESYGQERFAGVHIKPTLDVKEK